MTLSLRHAFTSPVADAQTAGEVGPDEWNALHVLQQAAATLLGREAGLDGDTQELTPTQVKALLAIAVSDVASLQAALDAKQSLDATLTALAGLVGAENKFPYFTGVDAAALADLSAFSRTLFDDATANAWLTTLTATRSETGAVARPVLTVIHDQRSAAAFGVGSGGDDVACMQAALDAAAGKTLHLPEGTIYPIGSGAYVWLVATGTNIIGAGENCTIFDYSGVGPSTDVFRFTPAAISAGMIITGFSASASHATVARGRDFFSFITSGATNYFAKIDIYDTTIAGVVGGVQVGIGRNVLRIDNAGLHVGGGVTHSAFRDNNWNAVAETVKVIDGGDDLKFSGNIIVSSGSRGYEIDLIAGAGHFISENETIACKEGAYRFLSGAAPQILNPLIEQTGTNTAGSVIDILGSGSKIEGGLISGVQYQEPSSLGGPIPINLDNCDGVIVTDCPKIRRFAAGTHVNVTANATNCFVDDASIRFYLDSVLTTGTIVNVGTNTLRSSGVIAATIASAATVELGSTVGQAVSVTGTTTITSFGSTAPPGAIKSVAFAGALTLTHNASAIILPGGVDITTAAGDCLMVRHGSAGVWRVINYMSGSQSNYGRSLTNLASKAAVQTELLSGLILGGKLIGANFNSTADQAITITSPTARYRILQIIVTNASTSLTTAAGGIYTAAAKGGVQVVTSAQAYSGITSTAVDTLANTAILNTTNTNTMVNSVETIYLSLTTPQGGAATADVYVFIKPLY